MVCAQQAHQLHGQCAGPTCPPPPTHSAGCGRGPLAFQDRHPAAAAGKLPLSTGFAGDAAAVCCVLAWVCSAWQSTLCCAVTSASGKRAATTAPTAPRANGATQPMLPAVALLFFRPAVPRQRQGLLLCVQPGLDVLRPQLGRCARGNGAASGRALLRTGRLVSTQSTSYRAVPLCTHAHAGHPGTG